jgi:hypothetical protein
MGAICYSWTEEITLAQGRGSKQGPHKPDNLQACVQVGGGHPLGRAAKALSIAFCHLLNEQRTFRLDRIIEMRSGGESLVTGASRSDS